MRGPDGASSGRPHEVAAPGDAGEKVTIPDVGRATLEISNLAQVEMIDRAEVGRRVSPRLRVASEVRGCRVRHRGAGGRRRRAVAPATVTPWDSLNSRLSAPGGLQITVFEERAGSPEHG